MAPKRKATSTPEKNAAKRAKMEAVLLTKNLEIVRKALLNDKYQTNPEAPRSLRQMFVNMLDTMLGDCQENRHNFQARMIDMVNDHLGKVEQSLMDSLQEKKVFSDNAVEERLKLVSAIEAAKREHEEKIELRKEKDSTLKAEVVLLATAEKELQAAIKNCGTIEKSKEVQLEEEATTKSIYEEIFKVLKETPPPKNSAKSRKLVEKMLPQLEKMEIDASLLRAGPSALVMPVESRGSFDQVSIDSIDAAFQKTFAEISQKLADHGAEVEGAEQAKSANESAVETRKAAVEAAKEALGAAKEAEQNALQGLKDLEKEVKEHDKKSAKLESDTHSAEAELGNFGDVKVAFNHCATRTAVLIEEREEPNMELQDLQECQEMVAPVA